MNTTEHEQYMHWGKNADWEFQGLVEHMFDANAIRSWQKARQSLLSPEMRALFSNKFLHDIKLAGIADGPNPADDPIT